MSFFKYRTWADCAGQPEGYEPFMLSPADPDGERELLDVGVDPFNLSGLGVVVQNEGVGLTPFPHEWAAIWIRDKFGMDPKITLPHPAPPPAPKVYEEYNPQTGQYEAKMQDWNPSILFDWGAEIDSAQRSGFSQGSRMGAQVMSQREQEASKTTRWVLLAAAGLGALMLLRK
jgi:hypothetical protein